MLYTGSMDDNGQARENTHRNPTSAGDRIRQSLSAPSPVMLCFFGFALSRCSNTILGHHFASAAGPQPFWGEDLCALASLAVFLLCAAFARRIAPFHSKALPLNLAVATSLAAAVFDVLSYTGGSFSQAALILAIIAGGISGALFILLWAEFHSCLDPLRIVFYVSGAFLFGTVGAWLLQDISAGRRLFVLIACPLASAWCLQKSFTFVKPMDLPRSSWGAFNFPWKLVTVLGIYEFVYGMRESAPDFVWETYLIGAIGVALAVFAFACFFARRSDLTLLYRTPFALMFCGLAMTPIAVNLGGFIPDLFVSAGYALMFLLVTLLMCDLSRQYGVSVLVLCGMQELAAAFRLAGHQASTAIADGTFPISLDAGMVTGALTVAIVVASVILLSDRNPSKTWGASFFGVNAMREMDDDALWTQQRCDELSAACGLSPREQEVLLLLAQGKSMSQIERQLVIANGTVKSHTRRIYQKLGIHTKRELMETIAAKRDNQ